MIYENKFGKIKIELENLNNKTIGIAMSGGADSTLLCCLLANTIKEKGLDITIQPYNGYDTVSYTHLTLPTILLV